MRNIFFKPHVSQKKADVIFKRFFHFRKALGDGLGGEGENNCLQNHGLLPSRPPNKIPKGVAVSLGIVMVQLYQELVDRNLFFFLLGGWWSQGGG